MQAERVLPDDIKQEISSQLKNYMWMLVATHVTAFLSGGGIGFFLGKMYESMRH